MNKTERQTRLEAVFPSQKFAAPDPETTRNLMHHAIEAAGTALRPHESLAQAYCRATGLSSKHLDRLTAATANKI